MRRRTGSTQQARFLPKLLRFLPFHEKIKVIGFGLSQ